MVTRSSIAFAGLVLLAPTLTATAFAEDRLHHAIELTLEPTAGSLEAVDKIEVSGREQLAIKPAPGLAIDEITVDGETVAGKSEDGVTWIALPDDGEHEVEMTYGGALQAEGGGGSLSAMVTADGVFLPYGIGWLANGGAEDDRVTYKLTLDVPAPYKAVATGDLISEEETDGRYRAIFAATAPTEPPSVFAGDYWIDESRHHDHRLRTYFPADRQELATTYLDQVAGYIERFEDQIGAYPYDGFAVIAAPLPVGLGFPGATYVSSQILHMPFMLTRSLAHEILHNWWANGVFVDYDEGNWAEGLTTYMADYGLAETEAAESDNADAAWDMRLGWLRDFAALPEERDRPIRTFHSKGHDADQVVGYNKVAMVFHMLRQELGEDIFNAGLEAFWDANKFETAGWSDLQTSFEAAADGRGLDAFFEPWLTRKGAPALTLDRAELREQDGGYALDLRVESDSPEYDLLVPVQINLSDGVERRAIRLEGGTAETTFDLDAKPLSVGIDQRHDLFRRLAANEAPPILRDVTLNANTLAVIAIDDGDQAAVKLAEDLATRTLDTGFRPASAEDEAIANSPLMLIGLKGEMATALANAGIGSVPAELAGQGTARVWVAARDDAPPALVIEADDVDALGALLRPLPHYGRQSFLVFHSGRVVEQGVWPTGENALTKRFD